MVRGGQMDLLIINADEADDADGEIIMARHSIIPN